jgi:hypothetical protein
MENVRNKQVFVSLLLSLIAAVFAIFTWEFVFRLTHYLSRFLTVEEFSLEWWGVLLLISIALAIGYASEKFSIKRILRLALPFVAFWAGLSFIAATYFGMNLFFMRVSSVVLLPIFFVHLKKLWLIDSELTDKLVELASAGHILEGKSADLRIETGLRLLETVFPLSAAIVFRLDEDGDLKPVGRARSES